MNIITLKSKVKWAMATSLLLYLVYFLCRYMFIHLHGMKEWPFDLLVFGLIIITVAAFFNARRVMVLTVVGYIGGFAMGIMFGVDGVDPGGGKTNNRCSSIVPISSYFEHFTIRYCIYSGTAFS
ncbi:MAG: hypothetical protein KIC73_07095 [Clostridiales bacterium]|nr:hypothetical protein [Clostridiales bacterium]